MSDARQAHTLLSPDRATIDSSRRACLGALGLSGLGAALALAPSSPAWSANTAEARAPGAGQARAADAWSASFRPFDGPGFSGELRSESIVMEGRLPSALKGVLYRNGPARFKLGDSRLTHWFDGDAMIQALRFEGGRLSHHGRLLDTPKRRAEEAAGRFLYGGFGSTVDKPQPVRSPDELNPGNINLLPMSGGRQLYALWEAGSAIGVDPQTLASQGFKVWSPETAGAPFSAHPRIDPDGTVWSFGYLSGTGKLLIYQIGVDGVLKRQAVMDMPQADMVHDFAITERHLVFLLQPLVYQRAAQPVNLLEGMRWNDQAPLLACVMSKDDLKPRFFELPTGGVFHLGNAHEVGREIRLGYARSASMLQLMHGLRIDALPAQGSLTTSVWTEVRLDLASGKASQQASGLSSIEFPRFDPRRTGRRHSLTVMLQRSAAMHPQVFGFDSVLSLSDEKIDRHVYGSGWIAEEHVLVPHPIDTAEGAGWVIGTAYHWPSARTGVSVFRAGALGDGPIASALLPYGLPLGLHGQFVAA